MRTSSETVGQGPGPGRIYQNVGRRPRRRRRGRRFQVFVGPNVPTGASTEVRTSGTCRNVRRRLFHDCPHPSGSRRRCGTFVGDLVVCDGVGRVAEEAGVLAHGCCPCLVGRPRAARGTPMVRQAEWGSLQSWRCKALTQARCVDASTPPPSSAHRCNFAVSGCSDIHRDAHDAARACHRCATCDPATPRPACRCLATTPETPPQPKRSKPEALLALARVDAPAGTLLLYWPGAWSIAPRRRPAPYLI